MAGQRLTVAEDDDFHTGSGDGNVHATQVTKEANLSFVVGTHHGNDDDIALLTLEAIDGIDADLTTEGLEKLTLHQQAAQILHLSTVGGNDADVDTLIQQPLLANTFEILL